MAKDLSKEVADIHQDISNSQGRLFRLLDKLLIVIKNLKQRNEILELQLKAKDNLLDEKQQQIGDLEEELETYKQQMEKAYYELSKDKSQATVKNILQYFSHIDQMAIGDSATLQHHQKPLEEAV